MEIRKLIGKVLQRIGPKSGSELVRGALRAFGLRALGVLLSYLLVFAISQIYDADVLGMFTLTLTVVQILSTLGRAGSDIGLLRMISGNVVQGRWGAARSIYRKGIFLSFALTSLLGIIVFFMAERMAGDWFSSPGLAIYFKIGGGAAIALSLSRVGSESLRALKKVRHYVFLKEVGPHLSTLTLLLLLYFTVYQGKELPILAYGIGTSVLAIAGLFYWRSSVADRVKENASSDPPPSLGEMLRISLPMLLASSLFMVINWTDTLMLGYFKDDQEVGVYNIAYRIANLSNLVLFAVNSIAVPKISEAYHSGSLDKMKVTVKNATFMIFWASVPIVLMIAIFPKFLLGLFGEEFQRGWAPLLLITGGKFISALSGCVGQILQMSGREKSFQTIVLFACVLNIGLNYMLIPLYGMQGAAIASLVSIAFWNLGAVGRIRWVFGFFTISVLPRHRKFS